MKNYQSLGSVTLGSSLRKMAEKVTSDAEKIYSQFGLEIDAKWFPVFYVLSYKENDSVVNISNEIGCSHVSVSKIVKEMSQSGLVLSRKSKFDSRVSLISLSSSARKMIPIMEQQCEAVNNAVNELYKDIGINLSEALKVAERHLKYRPISDRVKNLDDSDEIRVLDFAPKYENAFKELNTKWISQHWDLEEPDILALDNPNSYILDDGGLILIALEKDKPVGCCALIKLRENEYELAKMAVSSCSQGKGIGLLLGQEILRRSKLIGAKRIYLETNSILQPAVNLYIKLGFEHIQGDVSPYKRCNIQMEKYLLE